MRVCIYILIMSAVIYIIRLLPFLFLRRPLKNKWFRSFLHYIPYVTLTVMTFPDILYVTKNPLCGGVALAAGIITAWFTENLFATAVGACVAVFLMQLIL